MRRPVDWIERARPLVLAGWIAVVGLAAPHQAAHAAAPDAQGFVRLTPGDLDWKTVPNGHGIQMAVVSGNPSQPGIYVIRVIFPRGIMSAPHFHGEDRYVVVLKGTWYTGTDDSWDPSKTVGLPTGSFMKHPAGAVHFDGAKDEEVMVQITGMGPSSTTPVFPAEEAFGMPHKLK